MTDRTQPAPALTLADFLLARIAEDEAWANACEGLHWEWRGNELDDLVTPDPMLDEYIDGESVCSLRSVEQFPYEAIPGEGPRFLIHAAEETLASAAGHITRWHPAHVLAECEAKRRIVAEHEPSDFEGAFCRVCSPLGERFAPFPCDTLRLLALPYADHPDYREEWRP